MWQELIIYKIAVSILNVKNKTKPQLWKLMKWLNLLISLLQFYLSRNQKSETAYNNILPHWVADLNSFLFFNLRRNDFSLHHVFLLYTMAF